MSTVALSISMLELIEFFLTRNGDTESVRRREMQMQELENLKGNQDRLLSLKKVCNHLDMPSSYVKISYLCRFLSIK